MPNYVDNILKVNGTQEDLKKVLEFIKRDNEGYGSVDFNKIVPMPESLNLDSGSIEESAISTFLTYVNPNTKDFGYKKFSMSRFKRIYPAINNISRFSSNFQINLTEQDIQNKLDLYERWTDKKLDKKPLFELGEQYVNNFELYGFTTWYDWCIANWHTKWNAMNYSEFPTFEDYIDKSNLEIVFQTAWSSVYQLILKLSLHFPEISFTYGWADEDIGSNLGKLEVQNGQIIDEFVPERYTKEAYELYQEITENNLSECGYVYSEEKETYIYQEK